MKRKNKRISKKLVIAFMAAVTVCALSIPSAYALFSSVTESAQNNFSGGIVNVAVVEKGKEHEDYSNKDEEYKALQKAGDFDAKVVSILNKGKASYVRVMLEASFVSDTEGSVLLVDASDVEYTFKKGTAWSVDSNQTYYYTKALNTGETSDVLLEKVTIKTDVPAGYHLEVKVVNDAISAQSKGNLQKAWGIADFSHTTPVK